MITTIWSGRTDHCGLEWQKLNVLMTKQGYDGGGSRGRNAYIMFRKQRGNQSGYGRDFEARGNSYQDEVLKVPKF